MPKKSDPQFLKDAKRALSSDEEQLQRSRFGGRDRTEELSAMEMTVGRLKREMAKRVAIAPNIDKIIRKLSDLRLS